MNWIYAEGGVIDEAPRIADVLQNAFLTLLVWAGVLVLIAFVVLGMLYLFSGGNEQKLALIKRGVGMSVVGVVIILSSFILLWMIKILLSGG
jgi:hypothetical protein